jgi:hypothetical protein
MSVVVEAFLATQDPPRFVTWQELADLTGASIATCQRILRATDGHAFLLAQDDDLGLRSTRDPAEAEAFTLRMEAQLQQLRAIANTLVIASNETST